ncbi:sigma-70 family RNA polymerase sigma factor [Paenibacillus cymbidii]|uniref:sigma-70 family RNA polymerase sigma factor n=1 Tax=Paenibacillus cymbidii TaxID=1639034 RepID=UPI00108154DD|nr:sigma-70 family RNA polymerase sigma factor [Paenibacillus cymbidii]
MRETACDTENAAALLREMADGSMDAFDRFYSRYAGLIYKIAAHMLGDAMEAEDACHDIFLEVLQKPGKFDPARGSVEAWLAVKTRSRCIDRLRQRKRTVVGSAAAERAETTTAEERVLVNLQRESLREAMRQIPSRQQQALRGMYYEHRTQQELAKTLERPLGTVKSLVRYGLGNLRRKMEQLGWGDSPQSGSAGEGRIYGGKPQ